ncbi:UvrD/REP helicase [Oleispira antarctica RB-8]|uniref:DNA 3'-5' helicase n=1 Tax=Oleispira antarctica RB-8 TaxID=698738 RepID=R4YL04_OLEAN|nr:UvrD/REP helicase [Oleispira antarctica RB-8]
MNALTPEQLSIVHHQQGHARVIAVAGAGKTTTLVHFIQQRLLAGSNPKRMLVLMYNKAAQTDFQIKLQTVIRQPDAISGFQYHGPLPDVRTFHALGFKIYHRLISEGHLPGIQQDLIGAGEMDGVVWRLLQQVASSQGFEETRQDILSQRKKWVEPAVAFIDLVKSDLLSPADMFEESELPHQCQIFIETFERFEQWRKEHNRITFSDMLYDPCVLFKQRPEIAEQFSGHMEWILVDEYQDVNGIQQFLLQILYGNRGYRGNGQVMVIGDADQTIYEFRGSKPEYITKEFEKAFSSPFQLDGTEITHTSYQLPHTFRYGHKLSLLANQVIGENQDREDVLCLSHPSTPNTRIHLKHNSDYSQEVLNLLNELAEKRPLEDVAILNRLWGISAPIELALLQADMPYQLDHSQTVLDRFELEVFWILFEIASDNFKQRNRRQRKAAWLTLLTQPFPKVKRALLEDMAENISQHDSDLSQALWDAIPKDISKWQRQQLEDRGQVIEAAEMASIAKAPSESEPKLSHTKARELKAWQLAQQYINATDLYEGIKDSAFSAQQIEDRSETIKAFVSFLRVTNKPANKIYAYLQELKQRHQNKQSSGVRITSIHKAKGLEWPVVIIPALSARYYPYEAEGTFTTKSSEESERRLFYVAMTRAKEDLYLIAPPAWNKKQEKPQKTQAETQQTKDWPSKFLREADFNLCQQVGEMIEQGEVLTELQELEAIQIKKSQSLIERYSEKIQFDLPVKLKLKRDSQPVANGISTSKKYELEDDDAEYQKGQWLVHGKLGKGRVVRDEKKYVTIYFSADKKERKLDKTIARPWLSEI